jgi:Chaperone of endosialidase
MAYAPFSGLTGTIGALNSMLQQLFYMREYFTDSNYAGATPYVYLLSGIGGGQVALGTSAMWAGQTSRMVLSHPGGATAFGLTVHTLDTGTSRALNFIQGGSANGAGSPTLVGSITTTTTATAYNTSSDRRLKRDIVDAPDFGAVLDSMRVRSFTWRVDGTVQRAGFIAQELHQVAPEAVVQGDDAAELGEGGATWAVDNSKLVPILVAEIQSLRRRVASLEAARA